MKSILFHFAKPCFKLDKGGRNMKDLKKLLKESVVNAKRGKRPKTTVAFIAGGIQVRMDAEGNYLIPKNPAECADMLFEVRKQRLKMQHSIDAVAALEGALKDYFINNLPKSKSSGIAGKVARVQLGKKVIPTVDDWDKLYKYIVKEKAFELLQRRLNETAIKERLEAGKGKLPGVGTFTAVTVSCTAL